MKMKRSFLEAHCGHKRRYSRIVAFGCLLFGLSFLAPLPVHAGDGLLSLQLTPQNPALVGKGASQRFVVLGKYADGLERDVTIQSQFSISPPELAKIDAAGRLHALGQGRVILTAKYGGKTAISTIQMEKPEEVRAFSFPRDIVGIFTERGCNDSSCHGSVKGRGGFKLSRDGAYPSEDYSWIVRGGTYQVLKPEPAPPLNPRINLKDPEKSLLLLKPTLTIPHGGGQRFPPDSADYRTLLNWIRSGAPYGADENKVAPRTGKLDVFPKEVVMDMQGRCQLLVTAYTSNGNREDATDQVRYMPLRPDILGVGSDGLIKPLKTGETSIIIHANRHDPVDVRVAVINKPLLNYPEVARNNTIDDYVFAKLRKLSIVPSGLSSDSEFLRRVCLDLTGTLPPPNRVREFLASKDPHKRQRLIDVLLDSPEYVDYWTFRFSDLFRVALYALGSDKDASRYAEWVRESVEQNKPYDQFARERIAAQGFDAPTRHYFRNGEVLFPQDAMAEDVRVFWGRRFDCAQCHNHPYESWSQDQFWGLAAFYGQLTFLQEVGNPPGTVFYDDPIQWHGEFGQGARVVQLRTKREMNPTFLDGTTLSPSDRLNVRMKLAEKMTAHPYFAQAAVNRIWGYFFGKGIVDPVDDFSSSHPPTHPQLLDALAEDFQQHHYDIKYLVRLIVSSRTYQLSGIPNETNKDDEINYSRATSRPLDAEVLLDAISQVTGVAETFRHWMDGGGKAPPGTRAISLGLSDIYPSLFLDIYGRPNRLMVPERSAAPEQAQALDMLAGSAYSAKISGPGGRVDGLLKSGASDPKIIEELYLASLSRFPSGTELNAIEEQLQHSSSRRDGLEDTVWALISSREFAYNH
jgi:hypothetical protein